jgi:hypothetical protein
MLLPFAEITLLLQRVALLHQLLYTSSLRPHTLVA